MGEHIERASALDILLRLEGDGLHGRTLSAPSGRTSRAARHKAAEAELHALRTALAAATARVEELGSLLKATQDPKHFALRRDHLGAWQLLFVGDGKKRAPVWLDLPCDDGTGLPTLTPAARAALAETRKEGK